MGGQKEAMRLKAVQWSDHVRSGHLSRHLVLHAMLTTILKTLEYPLPVTTLSKTDCDYIMAPILQHCLPLIGVVRTFPRRAVYADSQYYGLNIPNLCWLQGFYHIDRLLRFITSSHLTGKLLRHSLETLRLDIGCNGSILTLPYDTFGSLTCSSWIQHTWQFLHSFGIKLDIHVPEFELAREHDQLIIPTFVQQGFDGVELVQLNRCRVFLQVVTLSDICTGDGSRFTRSCWNGQRDSTRKIIYQWPYQAPLPDTYWVTWKKALNTLCNSNGILHHPLGKWRSHKFSTFFYDQVSDRIYSSSNLGTYFFPRLVGRPSRSSVDRYVHSYI
jgi:hypothetical protein